MSDDVVETNGEGAGGQTGGVDMERENMPPCSSPKGREHGGTAHH